MPLRRREPGSRSSGDLGAPEGLRGSPLRRPPGAGRRPATGGASAGSVLSLHAWRGQRRLRGPQTATWLRLGHSAGVTGSRSRLATLGDPPPRSRPAPLLSLEGSRAGLRPGRQGQRGVVCHRGSWTAPSMLPLSPSRLPILRSPQREAVGSPGAPGNDNTMLSEDVASSQRGDLSQQRRPPCPPPRHPIPAPSRSRLVTPRISSTPASMLPR